MKEILGLGWWEGGLRWNRFILGCEVEFLRQMATLLRRNLAADEQDQSRARRAACRMYRERKSSGSAGISFEGFS